MRGSESGRPTAPGEVNQASLARSAARLTRAAPLATLCFMVVEFHDTRERRAARGNRRRATKVGGAALQSAARRRAWQARGSAPLASCGGVLSTRSRGSAKNGASACVSKRGQNRHMTRGSGCQMQRAASGASASGQSRAQRDGCRRRATRVAPPRTQRPPRARKRAASDVRPPALCSAPASVHATGRRGACGRAASARGASAVRARTLPPVFFRRASSWSMMPALVVSTITPNCGRGARQRRSGAWPPTLKPRTRNARCGDRAGAPGETAARGPPTPRSRRGPHRSAGCAGAAAASGDAPERQARVCSRITRRAHSPDAAALVDAAVQLNHNLAGAVVVDELELADVACASATASQWP